MPYQSVGMFMIPAVTPIGAMAAAIAAAMKWLFKPAKQRDQPVKVRIVWGQIDDTGFDFAATSTDADWVTRCLLEALGESLGQGADLLEGQPAALPEGPEVTTEGAAPGFGHGSSR